MSYTYSFRWPGIPLARIINIYHIIFGHKIGVYVLVLAWAPCHAIRCENLLHKYQNMVSCFTSPVKFYILIFASKIGLLCTFQGLAIVFGL